MEALSRFVLGDGAEQGYVLAHPKLADHLRQDYFADPAIVEAARAAFLEWGRDTLARLNAGKLRPEGCPPYLLLYLGQHLEDAGAPAADFMGLVEEGWLRAWEAFEGGYRGFSQDVRRAADAAARLSTGCGPHWAWRLRCQLVLGSIASIGSQVPGELLARCVGSGLLPPRQALHWLEYQPDWDRAEALGALAPHLPRRRLLAEALRRRHGDRGRRARAAGPGRARPAPAGGAARRGAARRHGDQGRRARAGRWAPWRRTCRSERAGALAEALRAATAIGDDGARARALGALAPHLPEAERAGALAEALRAARRSETTGPAPRPWAPSRRTCRRRFRKKL